MTVSNSPEIDNLTNVTRSLSLLRVLAAITFCSLAILLSTNIAHSQQPDPLVGKWKMVSTTEDGSQVLWSLTITYVHGNYGATANTDQGEAPVKDLKVDGSTIHFRVPYQGDEYDIDLKLDGGSLAGTWSGNGGSGETKGHKAAA